MTGNASMIEEKKLYRGHRKQSVNSAGSYSMKRRANSASDQKDLKSATIQAAPVIRKVKANSDQFRCASG